MGETPIYYLPLPENSTRQAIDSLAVFRAWRDAVRAAQPYAGSMRFKTERGYDYLVKTVDGKQRRMGRRSAQTEAILAAFSAAKRRVQARRRTLAKAVEQAERLNRALRIGRAPDLVIEILNRLDACGLAQHFVVVGTHAMFAYELAASVHVDAGAMTTQDIDLLWDARKQVQFISAMQRLDTSMLAILQQADPSFERHPDQVESAVNDRGFAVEFLRREAVADDPHPFQLSQDENDLWAVQASRASVLTNAPVFEHVVIATTGRMAMMRTVAPRTFIDFKRWMSGLERRPVGKRRRDKLQADVIEQLISHQLLIESPG